MTNTRILPALAAALIGALLASAPALRAQTDPLRKDSAMNDTATTAPPSNTGATTYCLGRFLIDVPAGSKISGWGSYKYKFAQIDKPVALSREQFEQETKALEANYRATKHEKDASLLRAIARPTATSVVMAHWEGPTSAGIVKVDAYKWIDGTRFWFKDGAGESKKEFQELGMARVAATLASLRPRADSEIPTEPGYCFGGGFIANAQWENEEAKVSIDLAGYPDAFITVTIYPLATRKKDKPLLERMGGAIQQLGKFATGVQVLRKGDRDIGPIKQGQEYLVAVPNSGAFRAHSFTWETQGEGTLQDPSITIELETGHQDDKGNPQQTRLSDEQAMKLWDQIVSSLRLRPVSAPPLKSSDATPPDKPLGELAATGRTCPQTGLWESTEVSPVAEGGPRRFLHAGDLMPHVIVQAEPSVWQKLKGGTPTNRVATMWKLVAYEPADAKSAAGEPTSSPPPARHTDDQGPAPMDKA